MKPVPHQRHLPAILIIAVVAGVQTYLACLDNRLAPAQVHAITAVHASGRGLLQEDPTFGVNGLRPGGRSLSNPFQQFLARLVVTDRSAVGPHVTFGIAAGMLAMIFMSGMYVLLVRQCHVWSVAVFVAVCSLRVADALGNAYWGVGALATATGEGLFIAATPWLVVGFLRGIDRGQMVLVFGVVGLLGNAYVPGAASLTAVLLSAYLFSRGLTWRRAGLAGLCAALMLVALAPAYWHHVQLVGSLAPDKSTTSPDEAMEALGAGNLRLGYVAMLKALVNLVLQASVLILAMVVTLIHAIRRRVRNQVFWLWALGVSLALAVPVHCLCLAVGGSRSGAPVAIDLIRASSFAMLPLYVFFAEALVALFRTLPGSGRLLRGICAVLLVAWFAGSDNVRIARHEFLDKATMFLDEDNAPQNVRRHNEETLERMELTAMAIWARDKTRLSSVFVIAHGDGGVFRMISRRAVPACRDDVPCIYYLAPQRLGQWHQRVQNQAPLLAGKTTGADVRKTIKAWRKAGLFKNAVDKKPIDWYLVRRAGEPVPEGLLEEKPGADRHWGKVYRLFKLPG